MNKDTIIEASKLLLKHRMTPPIAVTLLSCEKSPQRISDISQACSLAMCSASKIASNLEEKGLATRSQGVFDGSKVNGHRIDRRNSLVHLTPAGKQRIKELGLE